MCISNCRRVRNQKKKKKSASPKAQEGTGALLGANFL